ncbi:MAG: phosphate ABC transporter substrate-binding protein PstS [SAR202 cluster bacterium]|nr:phosphate ABC transporter substrate-binding protein PstS [SAR202 cluster bacterium]
MRTGSIGRFPLFAVFAVMSLLFLLAACGSDPTATPTIAPAATNTPTATPRSTPTPTTPGQATPTPTQPAGAKVEVCPTQRVKGLTGAGATFPFPLYSKMFDEYNKVCGVKVNYQSIGSGGGIRQLQARTVDFGGSDGIMTAQQKAEAAGGPVLHVPMVAGAVAVIYNLPGIPSGAVKLDPDVLVDIYLKKITKWNDPRIAALNSGVSLPNSDIAVVHRSDGSGTTYIFTSYLSAVSDAWKNGPGAATSVNWPGDIGGQGNAGVAGQVRQIPGAIGYVELAYAHQNNLTYAQLKNSSGKYVEPSLETAKFAADVPTLPDHMEVVIVNSSNPNAYPITGFTWLLIYENQADAAKADAVARLAWWMIHDGQQYAVPLDYVPLEGAAVTKVENLIKKIKVNGQPVIK